MRSLIPPLLVALYVLYCMLVGAVASTLLA